MSEYIFLGNKISVYALRDYIMRHKVDAGDALVLSAHDYEVIFHEMKGESDTMPDLPLQLLNVIVTKDTTESVPIGKLQIVKNDKPYL